MSEIEALPSSDAQQAALLGHILLNTDGFFTQAVMKIQPDWFRQTMNSKIFTLAQDYYKQHNDVPRFWREPLESSSAARAEDPAMKAKIAAQGWICVQKAAEHRFSKLRDELTEWMLAKLLQRKLSEASQLWNQKKFKDCAAIATALGKEVEGVKFDDHGEISFAKPEEWLFQMEESRKNCLTTGLDILDEYIMSGHEKGKGALQRGATTVILAPSNVGKSRFLVTTAISNIRQEKRVLYMTHEDRFEDIRMLMMQGLLRVTSEELMAMYKTPDGLAKVQNGAAALTKYITYIPINKPGMTVQEVVPSIEAAQDRARGSFSGKGYDLFINDYPAKLSVLGAHNLQHRHIQDQVYDSFVQLALKHRWHSIVAMQVNRTGSKINKGQKGVEERLLTMEDAAEAWGPMTTATTVLTLNRGPSAIQKEMMTVLVAKSRTSPAGRAVMCKTDYARCVTHGDYEKMGGWGQTGTVAFDDIMDQICVKNNVNQYEPISHDFIQKIRASAQSTGYSLGSM